MKGKEECAVVRDLMPLYIDKLTSEETNAVITQHLTECTDCNTLYKTMTEDIEGETKSEETVEKEVDYLKKIKKNSTRKVLIGMGAVILVVVLCVVVKLFFYGSPSDNFTANLTIEENTVRIDGELMDSASVYSHYKIINKDGRNELVVYAATTSAWNHDSRFDIELDLEEAKDLQLIAGDQMITKAGRIVSKRVADIYAAKHPYIGDAPKNGALAGTLGIGDDLGPFLEELQTTEEPYGWTLHFQSILQQSNEMIFNEKMRSYAYVLLATVDNVGEITWTYLVNTPEGSRQRTETLTALEADGILNEDIKTFADSEDRLQQLLTKVGLASGEYSASQLREYKYRFTLTGRMPNAAADSTFVVLTDNKDITFDEVARSLYSSDSKDWLKDTIIVSMK